MHTMEKQINFVVLLLFVALCLSGCAGMKSGYCKVSIFKQIQDAEDIYGEVKYVKIPIGEIEGQGSFEVEFENGEVKTFKADSKQVSVWSTLGADLTKVYMMNSLTDD